MYVPNEDAILESYHSAWSLTAVNNLPEMDLWQMEWDLSETHMQSHAQRTGVRRMWVTCHKVQNVSTMLSRHCACHVETYNADTAKHIPR